MTGINAAEHAQLVLLRSKREEALEVRGKISVGRRRIH